MGPALKTTDLRAAGWLAETPEAFRDSVLSRVDRLDFAPGEAVYQVGDNGGGLYGLASGRLEIHTLQLGEAPSLIHIAGPGFWTGEFGAILGRPRIIALVARRRVCVLRLSRAEVLRMTEKDPTVWRWISVLAMRNTSTLLNLLNAIRCEDPVQRVALVLVNLAQEPSPVEGAVDVVQSEIGTIARMSRGSVNVALGVLEEQGLIRRVYRAVEVPDLPALAAFAAGS